MSKDLKDKVLEAVDVVDVVGEHVTLRRQGREYVGLCPFHADRKPSLNVSPTKQIFKCFACGAGGDAIKFVQMREKITFREALERLAERAHIDVRGSGRPDAHASQRREQLRSVLTWARDWFRRQLHDGAAGSQALDYARRRGLADETIARHNLGLAPDAWDALLQAAQRSSVSADALRAAGLVSANESGRTYDRFRNRLIFPIADGLGRVVAFGGRTLGSDAAKYLNSPETGLFSKSRILYGLDLARQAIDEQRTAIVVEGYLDAVLLHQYGFRNVVATLGTALTDAHVKLLRPLADRIVLCFDGDEAGLRAADRAVEIALLGRREVRIVALESGNDPADCVLQGGAEEFERALASSTDALQFKWDQTVRSFAPGNPAGERQAVETLLDFIASLAAGGGVDPLEQGLLVRRLGELMNLPIEAVHEMLAARRRRPQVERRESTAREEVSSYEAQVRGLPAGLMIAVEEALGLLVTFPECQQWIEDEFAEAVELADAWRRLHALLLNLVEEQGEFSREDVISRCTDAELCEALSRCLERTEGTVDASEAFQSALHRLRTEFVTRRKGSLVQTLRKSPDTGDDVFRQLLEVARGRHAALPADRCWNVESTS